MITKIGTDSFNGQNYDVYMLVGNAVSDAEIKQSKGGKAFGKVSVAAKKNPDSTTMFVTVTGFRGLSATVGSITKGAAIMAVGKLEKREYNGKTYWDMMADYVSSAGGFVPMGIFKPVAKPASEFAEIHEVEELPFK